MLCCGVLCCQDAGGTDRPLPPALLPLLTYLCPNELELQVLSGGSPTGTQEEVGRVTRRASVAWVACANMSPAVQQHT